MNQQAVERPVLVGAARPRLDQTALDPKALARVLRHPLVLVAMYMFGEQGGDWQEQTFPGGDFPLHHRLGPGRQGVENHQTHAVLVIRLSG